MKVYCKKSLFEPVQFKVGEWCNVFCFGDVYFVYNSHHIGIAFFIESSQKDFFIRERVFSDYFLKECEVRKDKLKRIMNYDMQVR